MAMGASGLRRGIDVRARGGTRPDTSELAHLVRTGFRKFLRGTMKKIADGREVKVPATIDDPAILDEIREAIAR